MKKQKICAAVCSAAVTLSLAVCTVPASALSREDFSPQSLEAIDSVSSLDELLRLADGFVAPLALAKGPKQLCYLVSFEAEVSNVKKLSGSLTYPSNINVAECAPSQALIDNGNSDAFTYSAEQDVTDELNLAQFSSSEFSPVKVGEEITEYRLQGETALQSLGDISVSYSATKGSSGSTSSGVKIRKILMADANSDGVVNTVDSLCILQASSGKITLSGDAEIAADIDRDGKISNVDALMAVQYTSDKIKTLWSHGYLTKEENPNITSGKVYRIRNPLGGQNLKALSAGSAGTLAEYNRFSDDFKYKFTYLGDGLYKITRLGDDAKALTASGTVKYTEYTGKDSQKWYVEGSDSSFYLVPLSRPTFFLTSGGKSTPKLGYNAYGGNWRLYGAEVTIYNYYDNSYVKRHASSGVTPQDYISDCQDKLNDVLENVFDIKVINGNTPTLMQSYVDKCTELDPNDLDSFCDRCPDDECNKFDDENGEHGHHTSFYKNLYLFMKDHSANTKAKEIFALSIGHNLCTYEKDGRHLCGWNGVSFEPGGIATCTVMVNGVDKYREHRSLCTMLHEQSHLLGSRKETTGETADTSHGDCVMSYNRNNDTLVNYFNNSNDYEKLYCDNCKQAIKDYIDHNL